MEIREKTDILSGKVALVTGAGKGIGRSVAKKLAEDGASVVINYNSSSKAAEEAAAEIIQNGGTASVIKCNVSDSLDCKKMIDKHGHIRNIFDRCSADRNLFHLPLISPC